MLQCELLRCPVSTLTTVSTTVIYIEIFSRSTTKCTSWVLAGIHRREFGPLGTLPATLTVLFNVIIYFALPLTICFVGIH